MILFEFNLYTYFILIYVIVCSGIMLFESKKSLKTLISLKNSLIFVFKF